MGLTVRICNIEPHGSDKRCQTHINLWSDPWVRLLRLCESRILLLEYSTEYLIEYSTDTGSNYKVVQNKFVKMKARYFCITGLPSLFRHSLIRQIR